MLSGDVKRIYTTLYTKFYRPVSALSHGQDPINSFKFIDGKDEKTQKRLRNELRVVIQTVCILLFYDLMYVDKFLDLKQKKRIDSIDRKTKAIIELIKK